MSTSIKKRQFGVIWFVELWERYAFYSFQSLFLLFITAEHLNESQGYLIFGVFAALLYMTPTLGGYIADKALGIKRALTTGAILLLIGYILLALSNSLSSISWALSFIIVGNGLFKPTPTALISKIFNKSASNSHSAFTIYYMGVNIGSFLGIAITPIIAKHTGYSSAFWVATLGMIIALLNYRLRISLLKSINGEYDKKPLKPRVVLGVGAAILCQIVLSYLLFQIDDISFYLIIIFCIIMFMYMLRDALKLNNVHQKIMQIIGILLVIEAIVYFIVYNQMFSTLILFAKHNVKLTLLGLNVSPATYGSLDSIWLIILSPVLTIIYSKCPNKHFNIPNKYAFGTVISGVGFITLYFICANTAKAGFINGNWMIVYFFFAALAELLVAALGFSLIAIYFRKEIVTLGMGFFMLAVAAGGALSGKIAQFVAMPNEKLPATVSLPIYMNYFIWLGVVCIALGIIYFFISLLLHKHIKRYNLSLK
ncbi:peptide MFS transporter [Facilibium subflavum]|uniref:peptide MFS transporter n=1 Tax=Facilibium subflavum TaxID=2219058 RepID=UPI000E654377|nr:oligopeptide:H+ symporter [Facilibium subflavum]